MQRNQLGIQRERAREGHDGEMKRRREGDRGGRGFKKKRRREGKTEGEVTRMRCNILLVY